MKNKISKIAIFTILMLNGTVKSQEFYTCIPNEDWVKGKAKEAVTDTHIQELIRKTVNKLEWKKIIHLTPNSNLWEFEQTLQPGRYRVTAAGAGGKEIIKDFTLTTSSVFKACVGEKNAVSSLFSCRIGNGGGGMGYNGRYNGGITTSSYDSKYNATGYGVGELGLTGRTSTGGSGCHGGGGGFNKTNKNDSCVKTFASGGGSYFQVANVELILKGVDGKNKDGIFIKEESVSDGYVIIEKLE